MAKPKKISCKKCGFEFEVGMDSEPEINSQWTLTSPMPDKDGNITITMMATWSCPDCGKTIRGSRGKTKGDFEGKSKKEQVDDLIEAEEDFDLAEVAEALGVETKNLEKILNVMIKKGMADGKIRDGEFIFN